MIDKLGIFEFLKDQGEIEDHEEVGLHLKLFQQEIEIPLSDAD